MSRNPKFANHAGPTIDWFRELHAWRNPELLHSPTTKALGLGFRD